MELQNSGYLFDNFTANAEVHTFVYDSGHDWQAPTLRPTAFGLFVEIFSSEESKASAACNAQWLQDVA